MLIILERFCTSLNLVIIQQVLCHFYLVNFDFGNRTGERFRQEIRDFLGFKTATVADSEKLITWLMEQILPQAPTIPQCCEKAIQFFVKIN